MVEATTECSDSPEGLELEHGWWGSHPDHTAEEWRNEVAGNETRQAYWVWVSNILKGEKAVP